jgi:hypothetical protein
MMRGGRFLVEIELVKFLDSPLSLEKLKKPHLRDNPMGESDSVYQ